MGAPGSMGAGAAAAAAADGPQGAAALPLVLIASVARNRTIGRGNELVWDEPADKRWFRQQTMGCPVIMGRKTWDSLPARFRPLPGRPNVVVTRQAGWSAGEAVDTSVAHGLPEALARARARAAGTPATRVYVMGGAELYAQALPLADALLLTEIDADIDGDAWFPAWSPADWTLVEVLPGAEATPTTPAFRFARYRRVI
jgi:dihydrofolate reductase